MGEIVNEIDYPISASYQSSNNSTTYLFQNTTGKAVLLTKVECSLMSSADYGGSTVVPRRLHAALVIIDSATSPSSLITAGIPTNLEIYPTNTSTNFVLDSNVMPVASIHRSGKTQNILSLSYKSSGLYLPNGYRVALCLRTANSSVNTGAVTGRYFIRYLEPPTGFSFTGVDHEIA
jgi:hypothetical protein